jgi:hypothetical protein
MRGNEGGRRSKDEIKRMDFGAAKGGRRLEEEP